MNFLNSKKRASVAKRSATKETPQSSVSSLAKTHQHGNQQPAPTTSKHPNRGSHERSKSISNPFQIANSAVAAAGSESGQPTGGTASHHPASFEYDSNPVIPNPPESPGGTSRGGKQHKIWEKQMRRLMKGKKKSRTSSSSNSLGDAGSRGDIAGGGGTVSSLTTTLSSSPNSPGTAGSSSISTSSRSPHSSPPTSMSNSDHNSNKPHIIPSVPSFSIMPGTKRLLIPRTSVPNRHQHQNQQQQQQHQQKQSSSPSSSQHSYASAKQQHRRSESTPNLQQRQRPHTSSNSLDASSSSMKYQKQKVNRSNTNNSNNTPPTNVSPSNSGFFRNIFSRSTSTDKRSSHNDLDSAMRKGHSKAVGDDLDSSPSSSSSKKMHPQQQRHSTTGIPQNQSLHKNTIGSASSFVDNNSYSNDNINMMGSDRNSYGQFQSTSSSAVNALDHPEITTDDDDDIFANATMSTAGGLGMSLSATSLSSSYLNQFVQQQASFMHPQHSQQSSLMRVQSQPDTFHHHQQGHSPSMFTMPRYNDSDLYSAMNDPTISPQHSELGLVLEQSEHSDGGYDVSPASRFHRQQQQIFGPHDTLPRLPQIQSSSVAASQFPTLVMSASRSAEEDPPRDNAAATATAATSTSLLAAQLDMYNNAMSGNNTMIASPNNPDPDMKRAFTQFHNMAQYSTDSTSAYLCEDPNHSSFNTPTLYHTTMRGSSAETAISSGFPHAYSDRITGQPMGATSTSLPALAVEEHHLSINKSMRLLKPVQGVESWQHGRRYLISPAALAASPLSVVSTLAGPSIRTASEAANDDSSHAFGTIDLGEALITYVGEKHHLSLGKWSKCRLVLRQNYLLEYDLSTPIQGQPRGFAHLECAVAYPHDQFSDSLELNFYASPCAKADRRVLMIRVPQREHRDDWIVCLNDAAQLRIPDLYDYDEKLAFGNGRYATVHPARRKTAEYMKSQQQDQHQPAISTLNLNIDDKAKILKHCNCALKIIDKSQFWRRVVKGQERSDTLVREVSVQGTLTARGGKAQTFLKILGIFETSQNFVLELELLEGTDLFEYIYRKGTLPEAEAADVTRDLLSSIALMNRIGLAHRDIKPANILMCDKSKTGFNVKVGDFGMSAFVGVDGLVHGRCGTPGYVAPEIFDVGSRVGYGNKVDVFSSGVTLYVLLCGYEPFFGETESELIKANQAAIVKFEGDEWDKVSDDAKGLILAMTNPDPNNRLSAMQALEHAWIQRHCETSATRTGGGMGKAISKAGEAANPNHKNREDGACCIS